MTGQPPSDATVAELRALEALDDAGPEPIRLFVSFAYKSATQTTCGLRPAVFGNAIIEIEHEPQLPEHIGGLQHTIETGTGYDGVIVTGWQRIDVR